MRTTHKALLVALLAGSIAGLPGCGAPDRTAAEHVQQAIGYRDAGKVRRAVIELKNALQKEPGHAQARRLLGQVYVTLGDGRSAEKELRRATELGVSPEAVMPLLGEALLSQGHFSEAVNEIQAPRGAGPHLVAVARRIRGDARLGLGQVERGCTLYKKALEADPDHAPAHLGLAKCALAKGNPEDARSRVQAALERDPEHSGSFMFLGQLERSQGRLEAAAAALSEAVRVDPYNVIARLEHAGVALAMDDMKAFREDLSAIRKRSPQHYVTFYLQALLDIKEGKPEAARTNLEQVLRQREDHLPSQVLLGAVHLDQGLPKTAGNILGRVLSEAPENPTVRRLLAQAQLAGGRPERALETLQPLLAVEAPQATDLTIAGEAYLRTGEVGKARHTFSLAQTGRPDSPQARVNLARANLLGGEVGQALQELETASQANPGGGPADVLLVLTHLSEGEFAKAVEAARRLVDKSPDRAFGYHLLGAAHLGGGDLAAARKAFQQALGVNDAFTPSVLKLADIDVRENKPQAARQRLQEAVAGRARGEHRLMLALARLAQEAGRPGQALDWVKQAVEAAPEALEPRQNLVPLLIAQGEASRAVTVAREAVQHAPGNPRALHLLGMAQVAANDGRNALSTYRRLTSMLPEHAGSHYRLGLTLMGLGRYDEARASLRTALELAPDSLEVQASLGVLENHAGNEAEAVRIARDIQRTWPEVHSGYMLEGDALMAQGKAEAAVAAFENALATAEPPKAIKAVLRLAQALDAAGRAEQGEARLRGWLESHPDDHEVRFHLAAHYARHDRPKLAITQYERLADVLPDNVAVLNNLATLYQNTGDPRAVETAERAADLAPEHPGVLDTLGWILAQQGQLERGLALLEKAVGKAPKNRALRYHYARALVLAGEQAKAKPVLEGLLESGSFPQAQEARALHDRL